MPTRHRPGGSTVSEDSEGTDNGNTDESPEEKDKDKTNENLEDKDKDKTDENLEGKDKNKTNDGSEADALKSEGKAAANFFGWLPRQ